MKKPILNTELYFIDKIGLKEHLSPTRSNGLVAMVKQMKMYENQDSTQTGNHEPSHPQKKKAKEGRDMNT